MFFKRPLYCGPGISFPGFYKIQSSGFRTALYLISIQLPGWRPYHISYFSTTLLSKNKGLHFQRNIRAVICLQFFYKKALHPDSVSLFSLPSSSCPPASVTNRINSSSPPILSRCFIYSATSKAFFLLKSDSSL